MISGIKCVVWDADNTLYETRKAVKDADMAAMTLLGKSCGVEPAKLYEEFKAIVQTVKDSPDPKVRHRLHSYGLLASNHGVNDDGFAGKMIEELERRLMKDLEPVAGVMGILENLARLGIKMIVVTEDGRPRTLKKLETLRMDKFFSQVITSDDAGTMKPSPKYYGPILAEFSPEEVLVVGDNDEKDLKIPRELGMRTILVQKPEDLRRLLE